MDDNEAVRLERDGDDWHLACVDERLAADANAYLGYLADRNYSPRTIRSYGYGLLAFTRWLHTSGLTAEEVTTDDVLAFLTACRRETVKARRRDADGRAPVGTRTSGPSRRRRPR